MVQARQLVHFSSEAAFAVDEELRVVAWNGRAQELLGYRAPEVIGRYCYDVLQGILPDGQPLCTPDCHAKLCFGCCRPFSARGCLGRHKDGRWVELGLSSIVIPSARVSRNGGIAAVVFLQPLGEAPATPSWGDQLRVFSLGRFCLVVGDRGVEIERWERKQALTLLKYLITHRGRAVHRERLIEILWPGVSERRGRERLKVTVYSLRRELRKAGLEEEVIETADEAYLLRPEQVWLDVDVFEKMAQEGRACERRHRGREALRLYQEAEKCYRGDYLEEDLYADWCAEERERLREIYLDLLERMAEMYAACGEYGRTIELCRKALVREPCREGFHRALMGYLWDQGRLDEALAQFDHLRRLLTQELGVEPLPETRRLYQRILQATQS